MVCCPSLVTKTSSIIFVSFDFICLVEALWKILILVCSQIILRTVNRQLNCRSKDDSKVAYCV